MNAKHIHIKDYNYPLPDERIAKFPLPQRDSSKLLLYRHGEVSEDVFTRLPHYLPQGALMVFNNTRVIQARLHFHKDTGALIEIFILEPAQPVEYQENFVARGACAWYCLVGNLKKWKAGVLARKVRVGGTDYELQATRGTLHGTSHRVDFCWHPLQPTDAPLPSWAEMLEAIGELPIPPYLGRDTEESDKVTYQTVYSKIEGSVAAPTAGLHFTADVLEQLDRCGIEREELTLHVGAGTFKPGKSEEIGGHDMHTEHIAVKRATIERLIEHDGEAIAVGTTSVRTLESLYYMGMLAHEGAEDLHVPQWMPYETTSSLSTTDALKALIAYMDQRQLDVLHSSTQIIIVPGYTFHVVRMMVTNFHQPQSTLLLLVSAFVGDANWRPIYDHALATEGYRFLSYGDACYLRP